MVKKILVNDVEISVKETDVERLTGFFKDNVQVVDLEGFNTGVAHELDDFGTFIDKAKQYSNMIPPDVVQFSEKAWGAVALAVKEFYLANFGILIKSHAARSNLLDAICHGLKGKQAGKVGKTWGSLERSHSDFYDMNFLAREERDKLLDEIKEMAAIIKEADVDAVDAELKTLKSVNIENIKEATYKIGKKSYKYKWVAY